MKALVFGNKVIQIEEKEFPVSSAFEWIDCANNTEVGWVVANGAIIAPVPPQLTLPESKARKISELASFRYQKDTGGFSFYGQNIATDDRSKTLIIGARIEAAESILNSQPFSINWKSGSGFVTLDAETIIAISDAMRVFVQSCFDTEKIHTEAILALNTVVDVQNYDFTGGWPE